jgi:hypothetical protein
MLGFNIKVKACSAPADEKIFDILLVCWYVYWLKQSTEDKYKFSDKESMH